MFAAFSFATTLGLAGTAHAGVFGGFAKDGSYRKGSDSVCTGPKGKDGVPACKSQSVAEMAQHQFQPGNKQSGSDKLVYAEKKGSYLCVRDAASQESLVVWDSGQVVGGVGDVYLSPDKRFVAIEFTTRFAGRAVEDVVVLAVTGLKAGASEPVAPTPGPPAVQPASEPKPKADPKEFRELIESARKHARSKRNRKKAKAALEKALSIVPGHPEAHFQLAVLAMKDKDTKSALGELERLAKSSHTSMPRWRVEARFDLAFQALRAGDSFRKSVGITRAPGEVPSLYERLVALGGKWEQAPIPCEEPQVNLTLRRDAKQRFDLVIRSKCQGMAETTRLDGTWQSSGAAGLALKFPNMGSDDDRLTCQVEMCSDNSGEDCVRCQPDPESEFLLRVVRR